MSSPASNLAFRSWTSPLALAADLDHSIIRTPALELINRRLHWAANTPDARLAISIPPQEGKSRLASRAFPLWALWRDRGLRIALVSYQLGLARRLAGETRVDLETHADKLGMQLAYDTRAKHEWKIVDTRQPNGTIIKGGGVYAVGIGGGLTGRPVDLMIIDDPFSGLEEARSVAYRERAQQWWSGTGAARLAPGAPVVVIQTRWHEDDLIGHLTTGEDKTSWEYLNIPAQAEHDPSKGEVDVLGREPGEFMISARGRTRAQWEKRKIEAGSVAWAHVYQGHPGPIEGDIIKRRWWRTYDQPLWLTQSDGTRWIPGFTPGQDEMIISLDCAFKDNHDSDYVAGQVWLRRGVDIYLLDQCWGHFDFVETCEKFAQLCARWPQAALKVVEDAANGPAVMASLRHKIGGIVPEIPQGGKVARVYAVTPFLEAGNVHIPDPTMVEDDGTRYAWVGDFLEECAIFPNGTHDDRVDAFSQAGNRLLVQPFINGGIETPDEFAEFEQQGWSISPV